MEFRQLRYFVATAQELHFGRAANRLHMTQPALSKQIRLLEQELGVELLARTKRTVKLTPAGQVLLKAAEAILGQTEAAILLTQRTARGETGRLRIGFTQTATFTILPELLRQFCDRFPDVELNLELMSTEAQVLALNQREIDIAFLHPPIDDRNLVIQPILEEDFLVVLPENHPLLVHDAIPLGALAEEAFLIHPRSEGPALYEGFMQLCYQAGFEPKIAKEVLSTHTRVCFVAAGMGVTFISEHTRSTVGAGVVCRPVSDFRMPMAFAAARRQDDDNPAAQEFWESLLCLMH